MRHAFLLALTVFFSTCLSFTPAQAQEAEQPAVLVFDMDFPGGTLADYLALIEESTSETINFVVTDEKVLEAPIPKLKLRQIDSETALQLIQETEFQVGVRSYRILLDYVNGGSPFAPSKTIRVFAQDAGRAPQDTVKYTTIFAGQPLIDAGLDAENLLAAMEIALDLSSVGEPAEVRFHEETGLIFANGSDDQMRAVQQLMSTLRASLETNIAAPVEDLEEELVEAQALIEEKEMELDEARTIIAEMEAEHAALRGHIEALEMRLGQTEEQAQMRVQDVEERAAYRLQMERERAEQQLELTRQQMLAEAEGKIKQMSLEYQDLERRFEGLQGQLENSVRTLSSDCNNLRRELNVKSAQNDELQLEVERLRRLALELEQALVAERKKNDGG